MEICSSPQDMKKTTAGKTSMDKIVVVEFPKSGASWFVSMIGHALSIPIRDIYVQNEQYSSAFEIRKHPWYNSLEELGITKTCVIKSHELPGSALHPFEANYIHMLRDGRDVVVSKYFFEKDFCVNNGIISNFKFSLDEYVEKTAKEWATYVESWLEQNVLKCRYEELLSSPEEVTRALLAALGYSCSEQSVRDAVAANNKEAFKKSLDKAFVHNTFVRKGVSGDWANHFTEKNKNSFKSIAGDLLVRLGYETNNDW